MLIYFEQREKKILNDLENEIDAT